MKNFIQEFKEFALRGNVLDMAIGIIIGVAFGKIVTSFVNDVIMPPIGLLLGQVDFSNLSLTLKQKTATTDAVIIKYGVFINTIIDFLIVAFVMFLLIKQVNRFMKKEKPVEVTTKICPFCQTNIHKLATRCPNCTSELKEN